MNNKQSQVNYLVPFATMVVLFFLVGFLTVVNQQFQAPLKSVLLSGAGSLKNTLTVLITFVWFMAYPLTSGIGARMVDKRGYKGTLVRGLMTLVGGLIVFELAVLQHLYAPAYLTFGEASIPVAFLIFLAGSYVVGTATALLQIVINPYLVACNVAGTSGIQRQMIGGSGNSIGTTIAPYFVSGIIFGGVALESITIGQLIAPFIGLMVVVAIIILIVKKLSLPQIEGTTNESGEKLEKNIWSFSHLKLGVVAIFFYVGVEVCIGANINLYAESLGGSYAAAAVKMASLYWGGMLVGRLIASTLSKISANIQLSVAASVATVLLIASLVTGNPWLLAVVGLFHSVMWSSIFTLAIEKLGKYISKASGTLMIGVLGGALLPLIQGMLADAMGGSWTYTWILVLVGEIYLLYYGLIGYKVKQQAVK
ncbi:MFS transporter [Dysgonomonas sp. UBA7698]|uniref:MFS transporter n=1 Tax=Dysgonomonas sp. UBA7698 TaxID=1946427 RepID=UPI0025C533A9|nr:MFS transporter [Dysgonomonas sp. UBA7698]